MSTGTPPNPNPNTPRTNTTNTLQTTVGYAITALIIIGMFVCLILNKVNQDVAIPVIVALGGVHVGSAINNNTPSR